MKIYFFNFCVLVCKLSFIDNILTVIPFRAIYSTLISNKLWHLWKLHIWGYENKYFNIKLWFYVVGLKTIQVISVTLFTCHWGLVACLNNKNKYLEISMETKRFEISTIMMKQLWYLNYVLIFPLFKTGRFWINKYQVELEIVLFLLDAGSVLISNLSGLDPID